MADEEPKLHIDSDWKKQAAQEKERLAAEVDKPAATAGTTGAAGAGAEAPVGPEGLPPPSFQEIVAMLGTQAFMFLGEIADPQTGQAMLSPPLAKHYIDLLGILDEKTKGNLSPDEKKQIDQLLYEARMHYVQVASSMSGMRPRGPRPTKPGK
jgi:hypothetical protein